MPRLIGPIIRRYREKATLSRDDIVEITGGKVKRNWLAFIETGRYARLDFEVLAALAPAIGTDLISLLVEAKMIPSPDELDYQERRLIRLFRSLPVPQQNAAFAFIESLAREALPKAASNR